ncbi:hypothetical protein IMSAGC017_01004 [Thomasclavelia cocleata]|uniref:Uncharacterized protein n=1 Tax=Thomasclavelia cocleata TaxID=69824 RepID=A0A829ZD88_9FIRM|nr:hypothetical protein IMSAGC017_01004 [Thomasclavelia cocleata]
MALPLLKVACQPSVDNGDVYIHSGSFVIMSSSFSVEPEIIVLITKSSEPFRGSKFLLIRLFKIELVRIVSLLIENSLEI